MIWQPVRMAVIAILLQALPPVAKLLESSMISHMLLQLPLLLLLGVVLARDRSVRYLFRFDHSGFVCAAIVSTAVVYWMLPINLDAAIESSLHRALKLISVPLAGVALSLAWARMPWLLRGVLALELWAMLLRSGWLYYAADVQLCSYYLQSEQYQVGWVLCMAGLSIAVCFALWIVFGSPALQSREQ